MKTVRHEGPSAEAQRFWSNVAKRPGGCWEWTGQKASSGYGRFGRSDGSHVLAHRFSLSLAGEYVSKDLYVCHRCDNPPCVNPGHLFQGTSAENNADRARKGRSRGTFPPGDAHPARKRRGEAHWCAKLTDADVATMRARYTAGEYQTRIAASFGVHAATVSRIVRNVWR